MQQRPPPASSHHTTSADAAPAPAAFPAPPTAAQSSDTEVIATARANATSSPTPNPNSNPDPDPPTTSSSTTTTTTTTDIHDRTALLRSTTHSFLLAFLSPSSNPPAKVLSSYFVNSPNQQPRITEHGPAWATSRLPFLGRTFTGVEECTAYFDRLAETLEFLPGRDTFPGPAGIVVDAGAVVEDDGDDEDPEGLEGNGSGRESEERAGGRHRAEKQRRGVVSVVGKAKFRAVRTGKEWKESFIYRLSGFDKEGRIGHWEIWADPLSAWEAVGED